MKTLDEIKQLMATDETVQADEALKEILANEPDNLQAKMLYGTCRQLLGDEEAFKRIHDELAPVMEKQVKEEPTAETVSLWKKYHALWMSLIVGGLVLAGVGAGVWLFGKSITAQMNQASNALYAAPLVEHRYYERLPRDNYKYGSAIRQDMDKEKEFGDASDK